MTVKDRLVQAERPHAEQRLDAAVAEQSRLRTDREAAKGTYGELDLRASLCAADEQVAARERWLEWLDEGEY